MLLSRAAFTPCLSPSNFFLNCGVLDECAAEKLPTSMAFDTEEYVSDGVFASDDDSATCGILCELELS